MRPARLDQIIADDAFGPIESWPLGGIYLTFALWIYPRSWEPEYYVGGHSVYTRYILHASYF